MKNDGGFTLAEMLVALALLALIAAYSTSALQVFSNVHRVERNIDAKAAQAAALRSMQVSLSSMRPVVTVGEEGKRTLDFKGTGQNVSFVAPLDDHLERGGLYHLSYGLDGALRRLVLHYQLHRPSAEARVEEVSMLDNVTTLAFRYSTDGVGWEEQWASMEKLPALIEVQLGEDRRVIAIPAAP